MAGLIERSVLLGLGVLTLTHTKVVRFVDKMVEEGEVRPEEAPGIIDRLVAQGETEREELRRLVRQELDRVTPVSSKSLAELGQKIDELTAKVEVLTGTKPSKEQAAKD